MVSGRSAIEAVKRMMSCKISSGGALAVIILADLQVSEYYLALPSRAIIAHSLQEELLNKACVNGKSLLSQGPMCTNIHG